MLTFNQYQAQVINTYPSLYSASSLKEARFKVMNSAFNVMSFKVPKTLLNPKATPCELNLDYVNEEFLFYRNLNEDNSVITKAEIKSLGLDPKDFTQVIRPNLGMFDCGSRGPSPCFSKANSLLYAKVLSHREMDSEDPEVLLWQRTCFVKDLPVDWFEAFKEFYTESKEFFSDEHTCRNFPMLSYSYLRGHTSKVLSPRAWEYYRQDIVNFIDEALDTCQNLLNSKENSWTH